MDDLRDMGLFPLPIYAGATANLLMKILMTYLMRGRSGNPLAPPVWAGGAIFANLLAPVISLRPRMDEGTSYPEIREMGFFADQHEFSSRVYAGASPLMLVWIFLSWSFFSHRRDPRTLAGMLTLVSVWASARITRKGRVSRQDPPGSTIGPRKPARARR